MESKNPQKTPSEAYSFAELYIADLLKDNLRRAHLTTPTPIQKRALLPALQGRDILGTAKTGSGKTIAFLLPILEMLMRSRGRDVDPAPFVDKKNSAQSAVNKRCGVEALVLVPTRELAAQIIDVLKIVGKNTNVPFALVVGGLSEARQLEAVRRGARIVIATPGRLEDYIRRKLISLHTVKILVLDEADRMVDMGFLPQMRTIMNSMRRERQNMCFSATLDKTVAHLVHDYLKNPVRVEIDSITKPAESVVLRTFEVVREQKLPLLIHLLKSEAGTFLVFTRTKYAADKVFRKLIQKGFDVAVLHGGKTQAQRTRALGGFKDGKHRVLIATDIAARGIHVDKIGHVVNYDMPQAAEDFIHRVGRTGRVEESGTATTFVMPDEAHDIRAIERTLGRKIEKLPLPYGLAVEPRSLHDEAVDMQSRRAHHTRGTRHFGRRRRY